MVFRGIVFLRSLFKESQDGSFYNNQRDLFDFTEIVVVVVVFTFNISENSKREREKKGIGGPPCLDLNHTL